jgi:high-affinity iron transporter
MIEAFVITLREGVEAALVVCLALGYLRKAGRSDLGRALWGGVILASVLSVAAAVGIKVSGLDTEGAVEGVVLLVSCALVSWLVYWMWRHGKALKQETEAKLGKVSGSKVGVFLFAFLMVLREGAETVVMLFSVDFTSDSILSAAAAVAGLVVAIVLGAAFYKGTFRVDLKKFFSVTTAILLLFAFQLLVSGLHEFAEAGLIPSGETYMRVVGPLMKHSSLFVILVLVLPFALMLKKAATASPPAPAANEAEERKARVQTRTERTARAVFAVLAIGAVVAIGVAYVHESQGLVLTEPERVYAEAPEIIVPVASVSDGKLHRFGLQAGGKLLRFLVLRVDEKEDKYGTAMDACTICNDWGYVQMGERILCRNCVAEINGPTVGQGGGCNPIPVKHERRGADLVMKLDAMTAHAPFFKTGQRLTVRCSVCRMDEDIEKAGQVNGKWHCAMPGGKCKETLEGKN